MDFAGTVEIRASRERAWAFLMDPEQVGGCGPGVESVEVVDATHFRARAKLGIGFVSARFVIALEMTEVEEPERAVIRARGQAPGSAVDAVGTIRLREAGPGATTMEWSAVVNVTGTIASVGSRLIEGTASKLIAQTFDCIRAKLEA